MTFYQIRMAIYSTYLTNVYGFKLKRATTCLEKKRLRIEYAKSLLTTLNISVKAEGELKLPNDEPFLLISNHRSIIDPLVIEILFEKTTVFGLWISKKELYNSFFFGLFTREGGSILLDRDSKQMSGFFKDIKTNVKEGHSIFLFPEGTRNKEQIDLSGFKDGASIIALKNRLPILPVYIRTNTQNTLKSSLLENRPKQEVVIEVGEPIDYRNRPAELEETYRGRFNLHLNP